MEDASQPPSDEGQPAERRWQPLSAVDRRVLGVLVEKAKTTPDAYPMSLNAVCTGCNQKSNRHPVMDLEVEDVEESLDRLREIGAVGMVEGHGRVTKYRHYFYDWAGADKVEAAVMAELLLRGTQTEGELRGRASRMERIADLAAMRSLLAALKSKGLVIPLTPEGRGHVVTHALFTPRELERIEAEYGGGAAPAAPRPAHGAGPPGASVGEPDARPSAPGGAITALREQVGALGAELAGLRSDLDALRDAHRQTADAVRRLREELD